MGTKNNPGKYDCYEKAGPDEPIFTLRAKLNRYPLLTPPFARNRIPIIARPALFRPLHLSDGIWLITPFLDVGKRLESLKKLVLAVWLVVCGLPRSGRRRRCRHRRFVVSSNRTHAGSDGQSATLLLCGE